MASKAKPTTLKRSGKRASVKSRARRAPSRLGAMFGKFWAMIPVRTQTIERAITVCTVLLILGAATTAAIFAGIPGIVGTQVGETIGKAGFQVKKFEVVGVSRMEPLTVYKIADEEMLTAMPLVDLARIREKLTKYSWVEDARVSRRLPDTLVIDIVERKPAAVWQHRQNLSLVDTTGIVLEKVDAKAMPDLPLVIGDNANKQVASLAELLDHVPALRKSVDGATWMGNRRWDLRFKTGETLSLPEGEDMAAVALQKFNTMVSTDRLLGGRFASFDMRDMSKMFVRRKASQPSQQNADQTKKIDAKTL